MKKQKNKQRRVERARKLIKGLVVSWTDIDPLKDTEMHIKGKITHRNQMARHMVKDIYNMFAEFIFKKGVFEWAVKIIVVFQYPNGTQQNEERELIAKCRLCDLNEYCIDEIKDAMRYGSNYKHTEFTVECLAV